MADFVDTMAGLAGIAVGSAVILKVTDTAFGSTAPRRQVRKPKAKKSKKTLSGPGYHQNLYNTMYGR